MKGFISKTLAVLSLAGGLVAMTGCNGVPGHETACHRYVDPCWPERYSAMARASMNQAFGAQVANGHVLDQSVWNFHFEAGKDVLTPGGQAYIAYLVRRLPHPDPQIFLQTAYDVAYDAKNPDQFVKQRAALNAKREEAIRRYVAAITAGRPCPVQVCVHDLPEPGMSAAGMLISIQQRDGNYQGVLPVTGGSGFGSASGNSSSR